MHPTAAHPPARAAPARAAQVSRAFGDAHLKPYGVSSTPELSAITLTPRDAYLVLASDGLWDVVDSDDRDFAASILRAPDTLGAARSLCDLATARGSMDNITVLVVALERAALAAGRERGGSQRTGSGRGAWWVDGARRADRAAGRPAGV